MTPEEIYTIKLDGKFTAQTISEGGKVYDDTVERLAHSCIKAAEELARLRAENEALRATLKNIIDTCNVRIDDPRCKYFDAARAALKDEEYVSIDDFFTGPNESTGVDPYAAFGEWADEHGYNLDDDEQRAAAIEAYK